MLETFAQYYSIGTKNLRQNFGNNTFIPRDVLFIYSVKF